MNECYLYAFGDLWVCATTPEDAMAYLDARFGDPGEDWQSTLLEDPHLHPDTNYLDFMRRASADEIVEIRLDHGAVPYFSITMPLPLEEADGYVLAGAPALAWTLVLEAGFIYDGRP